MESMDFDAQCFLEGLVAYFIVFEGLDGTGKSSLMQALSEVLKENGLPFYLTREPGGTPLGEALRPLILNRTGGAQISPRTELLLYEASRAQHVAEVIQPKLAEKTWVLSDRFTASSIAFQAGGRDLAMSHVEWLNEFATKGLEPDLTVLLDFTVEEARARRLGRLSAAGEQEDRIESEADEFHERVRQGFLKQAEKNPEKWIVLSAREKPETLISALVAELKGRHWLD